MRLRFKNFINNRTGLYFKDYDLKDLDGVIADRMKACSFDTVLAYYSYVTSSEKRDDELRELVTKPFEPDTFLQKVKEFIGKD